MSEASSSLSYVFQYIFLWLLAAAIAGAVVGWLLRSFRASARLAELEDDWSGRVRVLEDDNAKLASQWKESEHGLASRKQAFAALEADHARLQADFAGISSRLPVLENAVTGWTARTATAESDRAKLQADLRTCADARSGLEVQLAEWTSRARGWDAERAALLARLGKIAADDASDDTNYEKIIVNLRADLAAAQLKVKNAEIAANEWQAKHAAADVQAKTAHTERDRAIAEARKLQADAALEASTFEKTIAALRGELAAQQAPRAMAAAASASGTSVSLSSPAPSADSLPARFHSLILRTQREGWGDVERIPGVGPVYGQKLRSEGIAWVKDLIEEAGSPADRARLAADTGIERTLLAQWVSVADLLRVPGVTPEWAELLQASGAKDVRELHQQNPAELARRLADINAAGRYAANLPGEATVAAWVQNARSMDSRITH